MERIFIDSEFQDLIDTLQEHRNCGNFIQLKDDAIKLKKQAVHAKNEYAESIAHYFLAIYCLICNEPTKTISHCNFIQKKYTKQSRKQSFYYLYATICNLAGTAYIHLNDRQTAVSQFLDGYYISVEHSFFDIRVNILNNLGSVFYELGDYQRAIEYFLDAYKLISKHLSESRKLIAMLLVNLSSSYVRMKEFEQAKYWEKQYLDQFRDCEDRLIANSLLVNHILMGNITECDEHLSIEVHKFLDSLQTGWNDLYSLKMILEVITYCLKEKRMDLTKKSIELAEDKMKDCHNTIYQEQFTSAKVDFYQLTDDKDKLFEALLQYHKFVRKSKSEKREVEISGVLSRIDLENAKYGKRKVEIKNKELKRLNELDSFTGILNKVSFENKIQKRLNKKIKQQGADVLLLVDIDNFKNINDTYGHAVGDRVIKEVAKRLQSMIRDSDYVGRIGGDEFCAFLLNVPNLEVLEEWIKHFIKKVQNISFDEVSKGMVTVSIGAASAKEDTTSLELFKKADQEMYEAKRRAKNTYGIYWENKK